MIKFDLIVSQSMYAAYENKLNSMVAEKFAKNGQTVAMPNAVRKCVTETFLAYQDGGEIVQKTATRKLTATSSNSKDGCSSYATAYSLTSSS